MLLNCYMSNRRPYIETYDVPRNINNYLRTGAGRWLNDERSWKISIDSEVGKRCVVQLSRTCAVGFVLAVVLILLG
jgi:hypothetical protein